jgi:endonuclease YncB( thermonuclease family)
MRQRRKPKQFDLRDVFGRRRGRYTRRKRSPVAKVMAAAVGVGLAIGAAPAILPSQPSGLAATSSTAYRETISGCRVTDGDTIRCGDERIRLLAIDAPELPGHCRRGRVCAPGDPYASTESLRNAMTGALTIDRAGQDHYGRTLARVSGDKGDLSCWQLERGHAIYKADWDNGLLVARTCPSSVL